MSMMGCTDKCLQDIQGLLRSNGSRGDPTCSRGQPLLIAFSTLPPICATRVGVLFRCCVSLRGRECSTMAQSCSQPRLTWKQPVRLSPRRLSQYSDMACRGVPVEECKCGARLQCHSGKRPSNERSTHLQTLAREISLHAVSQEHQSAQVQRAQRATSLPQHLRTHIVRLASQRQVRALDTMQGTTSVIYPHADVSDVLECFEIDDLQQRTPGRKATHGFTNSARIQVGTLLILIRPAPWPYCLIQIPPKMTNRCR